MIVYNGLWCELRNRGLGISDLRAVLSSKTVSKFRKNQTVNTETILKVCEFLDCQPGDIMHVVNKPLDIRHIVYFDEQSGALKERVALLDNGNTTYS